MNHLIGPELSMHSRNSKKFPMFSLEKCATYKHKKSSLVDNVNWLLLLLVVQHESGAVTWMH